MILEKGLQAVKKGRNFSEIRTREKKARQDAIVEAAERVFAVKPFNKVSIRDIAREAGISHASIYRYFTDQRSLFFEAFLKGARDIVNVLSKAVRKGRTGDIEKFSEAYLSYLIENDQYFRMMTHFMLDGSVSPELLEKLNAAERLLLDQFDRLFRKMGKPEPVRPLSYAFFAAMNGILITFRNYPGRTTEAVHQHMKNVAKTIATKFED